MYRAMFESDYNNNFKYLSREQIDKIDNLIKKKNFLEKESKISIFFDGLYIGSHYRYKKFFSNKIFENGKVQDTIIKMFVPSCNTIKCNPDYIKKLNFSYEHEIKLDNKTIVSQKQVIEDTCNKFKQYAKYSVFHDKLKYYEFHDKLKYYEGRDDDNIIIACGVESE